ncbi:MAG: hypothetical protein Q7S12_01805 [bacterium]|nr:hypothetical protein [bacterium]
MYYSIEEMLEFIDEPNRSACKKLLGDNRALFQTVQGSTHNHQAWKGGYWDHIQEAMNRGVFYYRIEEKETGRRYAFTLSSLLLVLFVHDIEKPWSYELDEKGEARRKPDLASKATQHEFRNQKLKKYAITLTPEEQNAMKYVEDEHNDYTNKRRVMNELAGLCHICDVYSARVGHDCPRETGETWGSRLYKK